MPPTKRKYGADNLYGNSGPRRRLFFNAKKNKCSSCGQPVIADRLRPVMTVKSARASASLSLINERMVLENLQDCSHIRRIFGAEITEGEGGEKFYNLLLEYSSGGTLEDLLARNGGDGLPENQAVWRYTKGLLLGLGYLHDQGYVHRNLKPDNIILLRTGFDNEFVAKIGDYESVIEADKGSTIKSLWQPYTRMNYEYLSPEAIEGGNQTPASDIWAVGCIVFQMLTGKSVWGGRDHSEILYELTELKKGRARMQIPDGISENGREFLKGCFETEAKSRWTVKRLLSLPFLEGF